MGKLLTHLEKQLKTDFRNDAEDCIKIYNKLKEISNGHVWQSQWQPLVNTTFKGYPSDARTYKPTALGYVFLKGTNS